MADETPEFDPAEAEKPVGVRVEERLQAIEEKLGLGAFSGKGKKADDGGKGKKADDNGKGKDKEDK